MIEGVSITEQSTVTIGLLVGSIGTLVMATAAFVNLRRDVRALRDEMMPRSEIVAAFLRLARDNHEIKLKVPDLDEKAP